MASSVKSSNFYYLHTIITLGLMLSGRFLPAPEPLTPLGVEILGIFIGAVYGWTTVGLMWPSIAAMVLLGLSDYSSVKAIFQAGFGHDTTLFIFFIFIFAAIIDQAGVTKYIANWIVSGKIAQGRPWILSFMLLFAAFISSALVSLVGTVIICWGIFYNICDQAGYTNKERYPKLMIMGIAYTAALGYSLLPFKLGPTLFFGALKSLIDVEINYVAYFVFTFVFGMLCTVFYLLACKFIFRADTSKLTQIGGFAQAETLSGYQKKVLFLLLALVVVLLAPSCLPKDFFVAEFLNNLGTTATVALFVALFVFMRHEGKPFIDLAQVISKGVSWDIIFLIACAMPLSGALTADGTGIKDLLIQLLNPIFAGKSPALFIFLVALVALVATNFANNMVTGLTLIPIIYSFSATIGADPVTTVALMINILQVAFLTPAASPPAAVVHGNKTWLETKEVYQFALTIMVLSMIAAVICIPLGNMLF